MIAVPTKLNDSRFLRLASCSMPASVSLPLLVKRRDLRRVSFAMLGIHASLNLVAMILSDSSVEMLPRCSKKEAS